MDDLEANSFLQARAYAKINLYLHITGRRDDGYHLIDSMFALVNVFDIITVSAAEDLLLEIEGPFSSAIGPNEENLVIKAAKLLAKKTDTKKGALIKLQKNLPPASGIGGGSSDAATTLKLLQHFWQSPITTNKLGRLATEIGADLPAFMLGKNCYVSGIGDVIAAAPNLPETNLVMVNPGIPLPTADVYNIETKNHSGIFKKVLSPHYSASSLARYLASSRNDLLPNALKIVPEIANVLRLLIKLDGCLLARMSGSGATCFGLYETEEKATKAAEIISSGNPAWWVKATKFFSAG